MILSKLTHRAVNVLLVSAIVIFFLSLLWHFFPDRNFASSSISPDGKRLVISGVDFSRSNQSILLALDHNCRFCKQESSFYRRLVAEANKRGVQIVAAFGHDVDRGKQYLANEEISVSQVVQTRFTLLGIETREEVHEVSIFALRVREYRSPAYFCPSAIDFCRD